MIDVGQSYSATFLPEVAPEQKWDQKATMNQLLRKSGYKGTFDSVKSTIVAERYQSVKYNSSFLDYADFITKNKDFFKLSEKSLAGPDEDEDEEEEPKKKSEEKKPQATATTSGKEKK